jgi:uncharacterized protein (TIGR04141 family)
VASLTIFRIKPDISNPNDIVLGRDKLRIEPVMLDGKYFGDLCLKRTDRPEPSWLKFMNGTMPELSDYNLWTSSISALLLVKQSDAYYAVVFGYGASLLKDEAIDERFGLRATLNGVEPSQLRSIDHKRLEAVSRHTRENLSRAGTLGQFGVDINRDLLRAVTGKPSGAKYGTRLSGADQLTVTAEITIRNLREALTAYYELSERDTYKQNFPWVDNIREVRDEALKSALERQLAKDLEEGTANAWLAPPGIHDWSTCGGFRYRGSRRKEPYADLQLDDYFKERGGADGLEDGRRLIHDHVVHLRTDNDASRQSWPIIKCLVAEVEYKKERYILSEASWYLVSRDFLDALNTFVSSIETTNITLPDYDSRKDRGEARYNRRACEANKSQFTLLDQKVIPYETHGRVEICDLYTKARQLVHVKRLDGSSTLSHLFNQGIVSAELLRDEKGFRAQFLQRIPGFEWGSPKDPIHAKDFEVCFAIVRRPNQQELQLPFFSKLTLRTAMQQLDRLGFRRSMIGIPAS